MSGRVPLKQVGGGTSEIGDAWNDKYVGSTDPGNLKNLLDLTVPIGKKVYLTQVYVICRQEGKIEITNNGNYIGSGRTGAASPNFVFWWSPYEALAAADNLKINFLGMNGKPIVDIETYIHARITDI